MISSRLNYTPTAILIGNMITAAVHNCPTDLQVALGVLFRNSKNHLTHLYKYGVTCSYTEVQRFKRSAAVSATKTQKTHGIANSEDGMIQVVVDNFDTDIYSPNGKLSTHSLAMIVTQPQKDEESYEDTMPRLH